jgi:hypothetical protein
MNSLLSERSGLTPGAKMLMDGVKTVLELRTRYVPQKQPLTDSSKYVDLSYYNAAIGL